MKGYSTVSTEKMKRMGQQLSLSEQLLKVHPLVNDKLTLLQTVLRYLRLQLQWSSFGPLARLLLTFQTALKGKETTQSVTGFIGPHLDDLLREVSHLMRASLKSDQKDLIPLIDGFTQTLFLGMMYVSTQLVDNWKVIFPQRDPAAAFKAALLLRELGLTFILGTRALEQAFQAVTEGLHIKPNEQRQLTDIGMCFLLGILLILEDQNNPSQEEFTEIIQHFIHPALSSLESAIQEAQFQSIIESKKALLALAQVQLVRQMIVKGDRAMLIEALKQICEAFDFSYEGLIHDLKHLDQVCSQISITFRNIFYQSQQRSTTLTQSA